MGYYSSAVDCICCWQGARFVSSDCGAGFGDPYTGRSLSHRTVLMDIDLRQHIFMIDTAKRVCCKFEMQRYCTSSGIEHAPLSSASASIGK